jgi:hypothetical protein
MGHPLKRADDLATEVFYFMRCGGAGSVNDEHEAELRSAAFCFLREVHGSDPRVSKARDIAHAVLEFLSQFHTPDSFQNVRRAGDAYEQARLGC